MDNKVFDTYWLVYLFIYLHLHKSLFCERLLLKLCIIFIETDSYLN
jgi:hypothetical protein